MPRAGGAIQLANLPRSIDRTHQALHEGLVLVRRQPLAMPRVPLGLADDAAVGRHPRLGEGPDGPVEAAVGQP